MKYFLNKFVLFFSIKEDYYLILNTLNGAADVITSEIKRKIESLIEEEQPNVADEELVKYLQERGYISHSSSSLEEAFSKAYRAYLSGIESTPFTFVIIPTYLCNLACIYCYESSSIKSLPQILTLDFVEKAFDAMSWITEKYSKQAGIFLFGGEPLLDNILVRESVTKIFEKADALNWKVSIITNGTTLMEYMPILNTYKQIINEIQTTIDGPQTIHDKRRMYLNGDGTFNKIINGLQECIERGISITVRTNVDLYNLPHLHSLAEDFHSRGWLKLPNFRWYLGITQNYGRCIIDEHCKLVSVPEMIKEIFLLKKKDNVFRDIPVGITYLKVIMNLLNRKVTAPLFALCPSNIKRTYVFDPYGDVYSCAFAIGQKELIVGRYIPDLILNEEYSKVWEKDVTKQSECTNCEFIVLCGGGCMYQKIRGWITPGDQCQAKKEIKVALQEALSLYADKIISMVHSFK
ncbi:MAG: SPASM domain-containing protein [Candidatus Brockarchaeota archaeon]|nr:SPASM domain-containing protein [Candidatus Brockarchaeota archaeon]MBO3809238.1 SPASM domain-containing protein [Candidatus Brockarchaeota archaeon]